jgi:hypothetical protein
MGFSPPQREGCVIARGWVFRHHNHRLPFSYSEKSLPTVRPGPPNVGKRNFENCASTHAPSGVPAKGGQSAVARETMPFGANSITM